MKKNKSYWANVTVAREERSENMREEQLCTRQHQLRWRGRRCSRHWTLESPAACGADHGEATVPFAALGESLGCRDPPHSP